MIRGGSGRDRSEKKLGFGDAEYFPILLGLLNDSSRLTTTPFDAATITLE